MVSIRSSPSTATRAAVLAMLFSLAACGSAGAPGSSGGDTGVVTGRVVSTPSCPNQVVGRNQCRPRPVAGASVVARGAGVRRRIATDGSGRFRIRLPEGHYRITATDIRGIGSTASKAVNVGKSSVSMTLVLDSGIR